MYTFTDACVYLCWYVWVKEGDICVYISVNVRMYAFLFICIRVWSGIRRCMFDRFVPISRFAPASAHSRPLLCYPHPLRHPCRTSTPFCLPSPPPPPFLRSTIRTYAFAPAPLLGLNTGRVCPITVETSWSLMGENWNL